MALVLNDAANAKKAPTGPNPQGRLPAAVNQGVAPAGAGANQATGAQPAAPIGAKTTYDYSSDPILQLTTANSNLAIQQAQAAALAQQKQQLIQYGDPGLALAILGDKNTADAAAANTSSTLAQLAAKNKQAVRDTNETENKANLTFSSDRGYKLGLAQQAYLNDQSAAAGSLQSNLTGINQDVLAATQKAAGDEISAASAAYNRAIKNPIGVTQTHMAGAAQLPQVHGTVPAGSPLTQSLLLSRLPGRVSNSTAAPKNYQAAARAA